MADDVRRDSPFDDYGDVAPVNPFERMYGRLAPAQPSAAPSAPAAPAEAADWQRAIVDYTTHPTYHLPESDLAAEPAEENPFVKMYGGKLARNPFDDYGELAPATSAAGAFVRGAARSAVPAIGSIPAIGTGAEMGGAGGFAIAGPPGAVVGGLIGGAVGGLGGSYALAKLQDWGLSALPDWIKDPLGLSDRQQQLDEKYYPKASFLGGLAPFALTMRPGIAARAALPEDATAMQRIAASPYTQHLFAGGVMGGIEL